MNRKSESGVEKSPRGAMGRHVLVGGGGSMAFGGFGFLLGGAGLRGVFAGCLGRRGQV